MLAGSAVSAVVSAVVSTGSAASAVVSAVVSSVAVSGGVVASAPSSDSDVEHAATTSAVANSVMASLRTLVSLLWIAGRRRVEPLRVLTH